MSDIAIKVENLSKSYLVGHNTVRVERYSTLRDVIARNAKDIARKARDMLSGRPIVQGDEIEEFWALKDVSFEVSQGDRIGIIGRNGAGKSTLLKILSRITEPTKGRVSIRGRVASLLEVGTGFHPELTGRENIFLNGAVLGMGRAEILRKFDEIVAFSEVEKFLDMPVKRYSSGMYVRLAFSVAAHLEPEILIVDEVLAVGDAQFQKKCLGKMESVGNEGRTVLFVSHNMTALKKICYKGVYLKSGRLEAKGSMEYVHDLYLDRSDSVTRRHWDTPGEAPGNDKVRLRAAKLVNEEDPSEETIRVDTPFRLEFEVWNLEDGATLNFSVVFFNQDGVFVFNTVSNALRCEKGIFKGVCHVPGNLLNDETYSVMLMITRDRSAPLFYIQDLLSFTVLDAERDWEWYGKWGGVVRPKLEWETGLTKIND
jgi:lipopolysaccharide transport system ATP-binding protein